MDEKKLKRVCSIIKYHTVRAKNLNGEWVYGLLMTKNGDLHIQYGESVDEIDPDTICDKTHHQMFDRNVFSGDYVSNNFGTDKECIRVIEFHEGMYQMKKYSGVSNLPLRLPLHEWAQLNFKIIGNIYDGIDGRGLDNVKS